MKSSTLLPILFPVMAASLLLGACDGVVAGSGVESRQLRDVPAFSGVQLRNGIEAVVQVQPGASPQVELRGDDNLVPLVQTRVGADGVLAVELLEPYAENLKLRALITTPSLASLAASGTASVTATGIDADALTVGTTGSTSISVTGVARRMVVSASGDSTVEARELTAADADVAGSGSAGVTVCATQSLKVRLSDASRADYWCGPATVTRELSGSASLEEQR